MEWAQGTPNRARSNTWGSTVASLLPAEGGIVTLASGWIAVFVIEAMLYVVGTAFIVLVLAKERTVRALRDVASVDELTGLYNRRGFFAAAHQLALQQAKAGQAVTVLMFDLDLFKSINDRFGHTVGDEVLRAFATTVSSSLRSADVIGRFGGEEFVAMLPGHLADAKIAAERLRRAFEAAGETVAGHEIGATVSIGAASGGFDVAGLIEAADVALYRAKSNGRNRVEGIEQGLPSYLKPLKPAAATADAAGGWQSDERADRAQTIPSP